MGILRHELEIHIANSGNKNKLQAGFTAGRRVTKNLYIHKYCINKSYSVKKSHIVTSQNFTFTNAFDLVDRKFYEKP